MQVYFARPAPELRSRVSLYWSWCADPEVVLPRTFPSTHTEIIIHREGSLRAETGDGRSLPTAAMHIVGPGVPYADLHADGRTDFFAIRLMPGVLGALCGISARDLKGALAPIQDLSTELAHALLPVMEAREPRMRARFADLALIDSFRRRPAPRLDVLSLFSRLSPESSSVRNLARMAGWSERHLGRVFRDDVGLRPVELLRLHRFQSTLFRIAARPDIDLTDLALAGGYYDQAHMTSEVKSFSGRTPSFLKRNTIPHDLFFPAESDAKDQI